MSKKITTGKEVFNKVVSGLNIVANSVASTLGPKGRNAYLYSIDPIQTKITNDGASIANNIVLQDPEEDSGAFIIRNVSAKTLDDCGDGTSTTTVLTQSIVNECIKRPESPIEIRQSLKEASEKILKILSKKSIPLKKEDIGKVALISSEDKNLAGKITEIVHKLGEKAVINVEDSKTFETDYEIVEGYEAQVGFTSPHFITDKKTSKAVYDDIPVLCSEKKISNVQDISPIFELFKAQGINKCVIVAEDFDDSILGMLVMNKNMGTFSSLVIRATGPLLADIAGSVGANIISDSTGITFQNFQLESLGNAKKIICDANKTVFIGDKDVSNDYINDLEAMAEGEPNMFTQRTMCSRVAQLRGGIAILRIGAPTDTERGYLKDKADDAVKATLCALEEGIVEGGGMTFWRISQELGEKTIGEQILKKSLRAPLRKIIENAGKDYTEIVSGLTLGEGYDAKNNTYVNLIEEGIIDPTKVERCALENAVSTASQLITVETLTTDIKDEKK